VTTSPGAHLGACSSDGPWSRYVHDPDDRGTGTVRFPHLVPKDDQSTAKLAKRTLTNLYTRALHEFGGLSGSGGSA
jgi:hypothetical protein